MAEPTSGEWGRLETMIENGSIGPTDMRAVLDYVEELQTRLSRLDVLAGFTDAQVAAIPRLVEWAKWQDADTIGEKDFEIFRPFVETKRPGV